MTSKLFSTVTAVGLLLATPVWSGENFALLIGASTYDNLKEKYWLRGPANDVDLVSTYLTTTSPVPFSEENVMILADGVEGKERPTLAAIRSGFAELTGKLSEGDFVYLHFSGHGSQSPALDPDSELDGLDEVFLPVDIGPWDDSIGVIENALIDDEIGEMIDAMRATGATVWAVFDSCHSGTVTRAAPTGDDDVRLRKLGPEALGIPREAMAEAASQSRALPDPRKRADSPVQSSADEKGGFIAFYAAQTNETTPEKNMPKSQLERRLQGVFTYTIFETLAENPGVTYRQLGQEVLRKYAVKNLANATPMFEGDLDGVVFSGEPGRKIRQWPLETSEDGASLPAGNLQQVFEGDILALMPTAASGQDDVQGFFEVVYADTFSAEVKPVAFDEMDAPDMDALPKGSYLRKFQNQVDFTLTVALPDPSLAAPPEVLTGALDRLQKDTLIAQRVRFVPAGADADVRLAMIPDSARPDAVWMLPGSGFFEQENESQIPSVGTSDKSAEQLADVLQDNLSRMARAINLLKIGGSFNDSELGVDVTLRTKNKKHKKLRALETDHVPILIPGDEVHVLAENTEDFPIDLNVLYVGSDYSISHFFAGRLQPGDRLKQGLLRISNKAFGRDRVVLVMSPAKPQTGIENLGFLTQDALEITRGHASSVSSALKEAGFGVVTRGAVALDDGEDGPSAAIISFEIDTVPAQ